MPNLDVRKAVSGVALRVERDEQRHAQSTHTVDHADHVNHADKPQPLIGFGQVRHTRLRPARNAFTYSTYFLMLPMRQMDAKVNEASEALARNRFAALSFYDCDHGVGGHNALQWLDSILLQEGITDATGEAWLQCYPRVLGHTFKPVSFWYCHRLDGSLRAVVVEVNNTFGERHVYLLDQPAYGQEQIASKVFHVSPFCATEGHYRFRFMRTMATEDALEPGAGPRAGGERVVARIDHGDALGPLIHTSLSGVLEPLSAHSQRKALWRYGAMTVAVVARIHWQALRLWLKRVPFYKKPTPPSALVTR